MREILLLILGAILGWLGQWAFYRYQQRDEQKQGPMIIVSKKAIGEKIAAEIRNIGVDTLMEMEVQASWIADGQHQALPLRNFVRAGETTASGLTSIATGETLTVDGLPRSTDDGIIDIQINGLGAKSQRLYSTVAQIDVSLMLKS